MRDWTDIKIKEQLRKRYKSLIPFLQKIARKCGYAIAVHGSLERDLDLIAVPWVEKPLKPESLIMAIEKSLLKKVYRRTRPQIKKDFSRNQKPFGRKGIIITFANLASDFKGNSMGHQQRHAMIDLSVIPLPPLK